MSEIDDRGATRLDKTLAVILPLYGVVFSALAMRSSQPTRGRDLMLFSLFGTPLHLIYACTVLWMMFKAWDSAS